MWGIFAFKDAPFNFLNIGYTEIAAESIGKFSYLVDNVGNKFSGKILTFLPFLHIIYFKRGYQ